MKLAIVCGISLVSLSLAAAVGGCSAAPVDVAPTEPASVAAVDTTEHALSVVSSNLRPTVADGRAVDSWQTFLTGTSAFRVRGVTAEGETLADFTFRPDFSGDGAGASLVVETLLPERSTLRIVNGAVIEGLNVSASTQALYDAMGQDLEALAGDSGDADGRPAAGAVVGGVAPQGWWACTKASAKVTYHCGGSAVKLLACLRKARSASAFEACVSAVGTDCKNAAKTWYHECL